MGYGQISQRAALIRPAPTHKAIGRVFFCNLWPRLFPSPGCDIVGAAQSHYAPSGAGDDSPDRWLRRAARYALRASRSVVVSLSLSRRNAASESEESKKGLSHMRQSLFLCYFRQHGGNLESSPVFVFPLDEQLPEQLLQQLAVPLNRPRIWWMKYATAMMTTIATIMVAGLIDIPPLGISNYSL